MNKNKLYLFILGACLLGYCWLFYTMNKIEDSNFSVCLFKNATNIPCPSCGTTRAVAQIAKGHLFLSIFINPFGIIVALIMVISPVWIVSDLLFKKDSFYQFYKKTEQIISKKYIAVILILLVLLNWYWNIKKGL